MPILKQEPFFDIIQLVVKNAPSIYDKKGSLQPFFQMQVNNKKLEKSERHQVSLTVSLKVKRGDIEAYELVVRVNGIFALEAEDKNIPYALEAIAPSELLAAMREKIVYLTNSANFPPFMLPAIDFKLIYKQRTAQRVQRGEAPIEAAAKAPTKKRVKERSAAEIMAAGMFDSPARKSKARVEVVEEEEPEKPKTAVEQVVERQQPKVSEQPTMPGLPETDGSDDETFFTPPSGEESDKEEGKGAQLQAVPQPDPSRYDGLRL